STPSAHPPQPSVFREKKHTALPRHILETSTTIPERIRGAGACISERIRGTKQGTRSGAQWALRGVRNKGDHPQRSMRQRPGAAARRREKACILGNISRQCSISLVPATSLRSPRCQAFIYSGHNATNPASWNV